MQKPLRIGMIGYGKMGRAHSFGYINAGKFFDIDREPVLQVICGRNESRLKDMADRFGWKETVTDWRKVIERDDIDLIDICAPSHVHYETAMAACAAGKHIFCEKPLALNKAQSKNMLEAVKRKGIKHMITFNYRFVPAIQLAKKMISEGKIGDIYQFHGTFFQDWLVNPEFPATWRLRKETAGSGVMGDLGSHLIDLGRFLVGEISAVSGTWKTFIPKRQDADLNKTVEVDVEDCAFAHLEFANQAMGSIQVSRFATGNKCANRFEIFGSNGALRFDFQNMNELEYFSLEDEKEAQGYRRITVTVPHVHPFASAWWGPGHVIGFENLFVHSIKELIDGIAGDREISPNFEDGYRCQSVLDALEDSAEQREWVKVDYNH